VAALTTSIPEAPHSGRNWDYRFCWLRDACFVIHALNRLGATRTMEGYLAYIGNLAAGARERLQPLYGIGLEAGLEEREATALAGYRGMGPVRLGNLAFQQVQNDVYGSIVLAATQSFFDRRLLHPGGDSLFRLLERLGEQARARWDQPDAGLWELRTRAQVHTFSAVMCWAACDRLARIAAHLGHAQRAKYWGDEAQRIRDAVLERAWCVRRNSFVAAFGGEALDASLLLLAELGFVAPDDPRFLGTLEAVEGELRRGDYVYRYADDDFGAPETAFNICTFWYIDALASVGRRDEARALFENMLKRCNRAGLLSEDLDARSGELWGNFPQTYSLVGLVNSAMRLSRSWEEAL
jgi:GH15 family glucan-1,4-alpha-glucosidase